MQTLHISATKYKKDQSEYEAFDSLMNSFYSFPTAFNFFRQLPTKEMYVVIGSMASTFN